MSNTTSEVPLLWVANPDFRGTYGIFSLCLNTMIISVWSAIHFDIPTHRPPRIRSFTKSVLWMLAALFSPELLLFIAFNQRENAKGVVEHATRYLPAKQKSQSKSFFKQRFSFWRKTEDRSKLLKEKLDVESSSMNPRPPRRHEFTLVHGFYASMGGFVFDLHDEDGERKNPAFLPTGRTRMTITSMGVRFLMEHYPDLIPDLSETSITDRSSASSLSKALLIVQLTWFCTNCVARLGQGLPLSLLEVTTVAHGLCTLVTYFLWWKKPLNIAEPTFIRGPEADRACALMTMCSPDVRHELFGTVSTHFPAEMHSITTLDSEVPRGPSLSKQRSSLTLNSEETVPSTEESTLVELETFFVLKPEQQALEGTNFTPLKEAAKTPYHDLKISVLYDSYSVPWYAKQRDPKGQEPVVIRPEDANRWRLAFSAMRQSGLDRKTIEPLLPEKPYVSSRSTLQSSSDFKGRGIKPIIRSNLSATALTLIYGVPHFLGWNARFPTILEQHLWRIATVMVAFWGASMGCVVALIVIVRLLMGDFTGERRGEAGLVACAASVYILTAGYLLLESLRQLLYLEPAAYELPAWSNYWPHVS